MGHRAGLDDLEKIKSLVLPGIRTPDHPTRSLVTKPTTLFLFLLL
jgi:hypothetical protein